MPSSPIKITDTTFRDAHQSLLATRFRTEDMELLAADMDNIGFNSMEVWGGATYDTTTRFLAEDPWERLRKLKTLIRKTPLMMLLRGQSLVGYRNYADDVVDAFIQHASEVGIDIFRVFDALNDDRNLKRASDAIKKTGKHLQMAISYTVTEEGRMGGTIYNRNYFVEKAKLFQDMGADSICLKDMGGLMTPYDAYNLVSALKSSLSVPLQLHTHYTSGMASMTTLKAIDAGIDVIDTCLAPLALRTSQPAVEPMVMTLQGTDRDSGLDLNELIRMDELLESILPKYQELMGTQQISVIDTKVLRHQIPGGMYSNLLSQLRETDAIDRLKEVLEEIPRTRKELGYPPLVTPMSQIIGSQAVSNVLFGRYKMISGQVKDYVYGLYGRPPSALDPQIVKLALENYEKGQKSIIQRPADFIDPELDQAKEAIKHISDDIEDILTYTLFPTTGLRFLRIKHGIEDIPEEMKSGHQNKVDKKAPSKPQQPESIQKNPASIPPKSSKARLFNVYVGEDYFQVEVDPATHSKKAIGPVQVQPAKVQRRTTSKTSPDGSSLGAPMPGIVVKYLIEIGQTVRKGDPVVLLEAMKMQNSLPSPVNGKIVSLPLEPGASVKKGEVLAIISNEN